MVFVGTTVVSMVLYMFMFLVMVVGVYQKMKKKTFSDVRQCSEKV